MAVLPWTDERGGRRRWRKPLAGAIARRPSPSPCPRTMARGAHDRRPSSAPAKRLSAAQTSYISQKVGRSSAMKVRTPRQSIICPCTDIFRRKPRCRQIGPQIPGGPISRPLALPAAARGDGREMPVLPERGPAYAEATAAALGAYIKRSYDAYSCVQHLAASFRPDAKFVRDMARNPGVYWPQV